MENASRALLMAAGVLLGVMIISIAVALFSSFGDSSANIMSEIEKSQIAEFNSQFTKYYGIENGISSHDVVTIVNLARESNTRYEVNNLNTYSDKSLYIQVDVKNITNIEKNYTETNLVQLMKGKEVKYKVVQDENIIVNPYMIDEINISETTGRVNYVKIIENKEYNNL